MQVTSCTGGGGGYGCGGAVWPSCQGWCPEGQICKKGAAAPCNCGSSTNCDDVVGPVNNLTATRVSPTSVTISWDPTDKPMYVTRQALIVADSSEAILNNCAIPSQCIVNQPNLHPAIGVYDAVGVLDPGSYYYVKVTFHSEGAPGLLAGCWKDAQIRYLSSCVLTPDPANISVVGPPATVMTTGLQTGTLYSVAYSRTNGSGSVTVPPTPDLTSPHTTTITGVSNGSATVRNIQTGWKSGLAISLLQSPQRKARTKSPCSPLAPPDTIVPETGRSGRAGVCSVVKT
jgi:hypothetical protein